MPPSLYDRVKMSVSGTPGTGDITLGAAADTYASFDEAGVPDYAIVSYLITQDGAAEIGKGTYVASGTSLSRDTVVWSTAGGSHIDVTSSAFVFLTALAQDIVQYTPYGDLEVSPSWEGGPIFITMSADDSVNVIKGVYNDNATAVARTDIYRGRGTSASKAALQDGDTIASVTLGAYTSPTTAVTAASFVCNYKTTGGSVVEAYIGGKLFKFDVTGLQLPQLRIVAPSIPSSATASGTAGQIEWDSNYIYVCVDTDTWKRAALSTW